LSDFHYENKTIPFDTIELDGEFFHPPTLNTLTIKTINSAINDLYKTEIAIKNAMVLYRIRDIEAINFNTKEDFLHSLIINHNIYDYSVIYKQKLLVKEYFEKFIEYKGKPKLKTYIPLLLKFIRTFHPQFPEITTQESLPDVINKISNYPLDSVLKGNVFNNNTSTVGVSYLKSKFKSYWNSSFGNSLTPIQAWEDDNIMSKVIEYRIGCNESNEIFDFSLHQLIRGLSARRYTISFFKPILAAAIYKHFLGDKPAPIVIDPCAGFGGRMLGFKSIYPNGTYIGIEPNPDTFIELQELAKEFTNIQLHNCKLEDYTGTKDCDLTFTSIPYFDTETYSSPVLYGSFDSWIAEFVSSIKTYNNLVLNIPESLEYLFPDAKGVYNMDHNTSHYNTKSHKKTEKVLSWL